MEEGGKEEGRELIRSASFVFGCKQMASVPGIVRMSLLLYCYAQKLTSALVSTVCLP